MPCLYEQPSCHYTRNQFSTNFNNAFKSLNVFASDATLSFLHRAMRGKRKAIPDLCLVERLIPSKAISKTSCGFTLLTGPNLSTVFSFTQRSTSRISSSVRPLYALVNGTRCSTSHTAKV